MIAQQFGVKPLEECTPLIGQQQTCDAVVDLPALAVLMR